MYDPKWFEDSDVVKFKVFLLQTFVKLLQNVSVAMSTVAYE